MTTKCFICCAVAFSALVAISHETAWINHTKVSVIDQFIDNLKKHHTTVHMVSVQPFMNIIQQLEDFTWCPSFVGLAILFWCFTICLRSCSTCIMSIAVSCMNSYFNDIRQGKLHLHTCYLSFPILTPSFSIRLVSCLASLSDCIKFSSVCVCMVSFEESRQFIILTFCS